MRDKLETLPLTQLRELAKSQGIKNITVLRKAELIDKLCEAAGAQGAAGAGPDMGGAAYGGNEAGYGDDVVDADYKEV